MVQFSSLFNGLARNMSIKNGKKGSSRSDVAREAADALAKSAKKNDLLLTSSGLVNADWSTNYASTFTKKGQKGMNQDSLIVWEAFGSQKDVIFCGVFDGHGPWGHFVAKRVRKLMPTYLLCNWQDALAKTSLEFNDEMGRNRNLHRFDKWKRSYLKACSTIDQELEQYPGIDSFHSGATALSIVRQGDLLVLANVGDSRAVLATTCDDNSLMPVQLTVDFKPNVPGETERIKQSKGKVFSSQDEPGVYRIWMPNGETTPTGPGLALSRAFGDYFIKDFGLISEPDVTHRTITSRDQFLILATDGVWDVISNQEAVNIVSSTPDGEEPAKRLVEHAASAWKRKRRGLAMDDISAICLYFHSSSSTPHQVDPISLPQVLASRR